MFKNQKARNAFYIGLLCSISYLAVYFARNVLSAVSPAMVEEGCVDTIFLGDASSLYFIAYAVGQLINGLIGDKISAKYMISVGLISAGLATFVFPSVVTSLPEAALGVYALTGFFLSMIYAPMTKVIAESTDPFYAPRCSLGYTFSSFLGSPLAGAAAAFFAWQGVFYTGGAFLALMACSVFVAFAIFEKKGIIVKSKKSEAIANSSSFKDKIRVLVKHDIIKFTLYSVLTGIIRTTVVFWMPTYFSQRLGFSADESALIYTVTTFIISFSTFISVFVYERLGHNMNATVFVMFCVSVIFFALLFVTKNPFLNIAFLVIAIMGGNAVASMIWVRYCPGLRDTGMVSSATGFLDFISYMSASVSSSVFAGAVDVIGWNGLVLVWLGLMVIGVAVSFPYHKLKKFSE